LKRQIDRLGEDILESVVARDRDREPAFVDREAILVEDSHALEEVVMRAAARARRQNFLAQRPIDKIRAPRVLDLVDHALVQHQLEYPVGTACSFRPVRVANFFARLEHWIGRKRTVGKRRLVDEDSR
jgi:hypothetical protein